MVEIKSSNMASRPHFFDDPVMDEMLAIILALTAELGVVTDRHDSLERVLAASGALDPAALEAFRPDETVAAARKQAHKDYLRRVFRVMRMQGEKGSEFTKFNEMSEYDDLMRKTRAA